MKLELRHLAPYLPYGLKFALTMTNDQFTCVGLTVEVDGIMAHYDGGSANVSLFKYYKPVLRPLSDLTKEIDIYKANENTSIINFLNIANSTPFYYRPRLNALEQKNDRGFVRYNLNQSGYLYMPYNIVQTLFENHFDVFGLIPAGLAIDINTLDKKP